MAPTSEPQPFLTLTLLPVKKPQAPRKIWWLSNEHKDGFGQDFHPRNPTPSPEHIKLSKAPFSGPEIESKSRSAQLKGK